MSADKAKSAMRSGSVTALGFGVDEVDPKTGKLKYRQQRATTLLVDVAYVIEAHFDLTDKAEPADTPAKHTSMFNRRAAGGQCFHQPCLGAREFAADFRLLGEAEPLPDSELPDDQRNRDLGWMLYDIDFAHGRTTPIRLTHSPSRCSVIPVAGIKLGIG